MPFAVHFLHFFLYHGFSSAIPSFFFLIFIGSGLDLGAGVWNPGFQADSKQEVFIQKGRGDKDHTQTLSVAFKVVPTLIPTTVSIPSFVNLQLI